MQNVLANKVPVACAAFSALLGTAVLLGWHLNIAALIQVMPQFAPMQYNTALGFLVSGIGLFAVVKKLSHISLACGSVIVLLGGLTLLQYIFSMDLAIDQFFMDGYINVKTSHPGRMAPNTALCFILTGITLLLFSVSKINTTNHVLIELLSLLILALSTMAFIGYLIGDEKGYSWGELTRMALHTTSGFLVLSIGTLTIILNTYSQAIAKVPLWVVGGLCFIILIFDMMQPKGVAAGVAYVPLVFLSLLFYRERIAFVFAGISTFLIILGYIGSAGMVAEEHHVLINRLLSIIAVWVVAVVVYLQKRTQKQLSKSEEALSLGWQGAGDGMWDWDIPSSKIIFSDRFKELIGYADHELEQSFKQWNALLHEDDRDRVLIALDNHLKKKVPYDVEYRLRNKLGGYRWYAVRGQALWDEKGTPIRMAGSLSDITEGKEAEIERELLITALEKSNDELDNFAYVASHDLKAPLRVIENVSNWLEEDLGEQIDQESRENLQLLRNRVKRMDALLDDLLAYSRIGRKVDEHFQELITGADLIDDIFLLVNAPNNFSIKGSDKFRSMKFNKMPLRLILLNLVSNAIKHHDKETGLVEIDIEDQGEQYLISVKDDGPGIDEDYHEKIFKMFQTLKPRDRVEGSGMGLAIVRKHIELQGGEITLQSSVEQGCTFYFTWPKLQTNQLNETTTEQEIK